MSQDLAGLVAGALLAAVAIAYVVHPLFSPSRMAHRIERGSPDAIDERVRRLRDHHPRCRTCGIRPETDARFCSTCGSRLGGEP